VSERPGVPLRSVPASGPAVPGPTISFTFNLGKIPDQGEDADPILRDGRDLALVGVFDGMGGAGGTVYETPDGPRTGAYIGARVARDVVERRMVDLLEPDWNLNGRATAEDLRRSVKEALVERLSALDAPVSGLRSRLLRALPTTMALVALQRTQTGGPTWTCHVLWSGDSRAYVLEPEGLRQLSTDDLRDPGDAMANLRADSVVSNAMSADTDFTVNHRRVQLEAPYLVVCATDGCFGYVPSPMHFEHLVLSHLRDARSTEGWSAAIQADIAAFTGDDAAMAVLGVGASFKELQALFAPRLSVLDEQFVGPLDAAVREVAQAEAALQALRRRQEQQAAEAWGRYKPGYERYLHLASVDEDELAEETAPQPEPSTTEPGPAPTGGVAEAPAPEPGAAEGPPPTDPAPEETTGEVPS
jgi:serine/threonine protein phosphatase PrpC